MRSFVKDQEISASHLGRRVFNFGQVFPDAGQAYSYQLHLSWDEFQSKMTDVFRQAAEEFKEDIPYRKRGEWPVVDQWEDLEFSLPQELLHRAPNTLERLILIFRLMAFLSPNLSRCAVSRTGCSLSSFYRKRRWIMDSQDLEHETFF